jgi:hypothetical protein
VAAIIAACGVLAAVTIVQWLPGRLDLDTGVMLAALILAAGTMTAALSGVLDFQFQSPETTGAGAPPWLLASHIVLGVGWVALFARTGLLASRVIQRRRRNDDLRAHGHRIGGVITTVGRPEAWAWKLPVSEVEISVLDSVLDKESASTITAQMVTTYDHVPLPDTPVWIYRDAGEHGGARGTGPSDMFIEVNPGVPVTYDQNIWLYQRPEVSDGGSGGGSV